MLLSEYFESVKSKKICVIGMGVSNMPLIEALLKAGCSVTACDKRNESELGEDYARLKALGCSFILGKNYLDGLCGFDIIFRTPGLLPFDSHLVAAKNSGAEITSEMELFFRLCPCRIAAVTGSDGKTTTTTIISELLKAQGYTVHLGGNIGKPLLCEVDSMMPDDFAVLELSSFQLHSMYCHPDIAVITNISPNHLDKHLSYKDYYDAKSSIFINQSPAQRLVLNADNEFCSYYAEKAVSNISLFSRKAKPENGVYAENGKVIRVKNGEEVTIISVDDILLPGIHNLENYMAAFAAIEGVVSDEICRKVAMSFEGVEHRLERVRVLNGVLFINDSIGTSPTRTKAGLLALSVKPILIAGGYDKSIPFDELGDDICLYAKSLYLCGATSDKIEAAVKASPHYSESFEIYRFDDFKTAVTSAAAAAIPGDIVLLSPACAAFDMFKNFAERGKYFKKIVMEL